MLETNLRRREFAAEEPSGNRRASTRELVESPVQESEHFDFFPPAPRAPRRLPIAVRERRTAPERMSPAAIDRLEERFSRSVDEIARRASQADPRVPLPAEARSRRSWRQSVQSTTSMLSALSGSLDVQNFSSPASSILPGMTLFEEPEPVTFTHPPEADWGRDPETRPYDPRRDGSWYGYTRSRREGTVPSSSSLLESTGVSRRMSNLPPLVYINLHPLENDRDMSWEEQRAVAEPYRRWRYTRDLEAEVFMPSRAPELVPVTREVMELHDDYDDEYLAPDQLPRPIVRLNISRCDCDSQESKYYGSSVPFYVDPLPMPIEDMIPQKSLPKEVLVRNAVVAGR